VALAAFGAGGGLGCGGGARLVTRDTEGGLFALEGDHGAAREDAERQIRAHCGGRGYRITADAEYTVAVREEQEVTQGEQGRRLGDDQTRRSTAFSGGTAGSALGDSTGASGRFGESPDIYDPATTGATPRIPTPVREHRLEYECGHDD
jgi:hypothetical protein